VKPGQRVEAAVRAQFGRPVRGERVTLTEGLAVLCAHHAWRTVAFWAGAIVVAFVLVGAVLGDKLTSEGNVTNDADSLRANNLQSKRFPQREGFDELVIVRSQALRVDDDLFRARVTQLAAAVGATGATDSVRSPYTNGDRRLLSPDRNAAVIPISLAEPGEDHVERVMEVVERFDGRAGFEVAITGEFTFDRDLGEVVDRDLQNGELRLGLPAALIVLVIVFGALVAAVLPLLLAIVSIAVALGLTALVAVQWELSLFVTNMLVVMGLALGIDYSLFVVSRFREERLSGREKNHAIVAAGATASRAVLFSGSAFVIAMTGLLLVQSTIMRSIALGAILAGIVSVAAALTLLPAVLQLLGDRVSALRVPVVGRQLDRPGGGGSRFWGASVARVIRRPAISLAVGAILLLAAAVPVLELSTGAAGISTLPDDLASKQGYLALQRSFPAASAEPAQVVIDGAVSSPEVRGAIKRLEGRLAGDPRFGPASLQMNPPGDLGVLIVPLVGDALNDRAVEAVRELRAEYIPAAFADSGATALVTGTTAENIDRSDVMSQWLPIMLVFVLGLSFLLLTLAFRSVVVAATAIALNLLSVGAAYGLLVLVFQEGVGSGLLGFEQADTIEAWVPLFLFAVLFGLSMDYQVFLLSRIRERYSQTRDNAGAISFGIGSTARIVTGAALIIVAVFAGFAAGDLVMFQQMGFGVAVALLIDATLVRCVLVPAAMQLLGERNWYLPGWLKWLPHFDVEGQADQPSDSVAAGAPAEVSAQGR
jgi:putative drug exporter of the RND superfamily